MKRLSVICLMLFVACSAFSQKTSALSFDESEWDFGTIDEADGKVSHTFRFTNTGSKPVVVEDVIVTCGCTVPSYSKKPVRPGEKGSVTITFDPMGRTEVFRKSARVITEGGKSAQVLWVKGRVDLAVRPEEDFPYRLNPALSADRKSVFFEMMRPDQSPEDRYVRLYNRTDRAVRLSGVLTERSGFVRAVFPSAVPARASVSVKITAIPRKDRFGSFEDRLRLTVDGTPCGDEIAISGTMLAELSDASLPSAPAFRASSLLFTPKRGVKSVHRTTITNAGKSELILYRAECPEEIGYESDEPLVIPPGSRTELSFTVLFPSAGNVSELRVKLFTNDPRNPVVPVLFECR